jgi:hypothetical protein
MDVVFKFLQNTNTIPSFMMISLAFTEKCRRSPGWSKTATGHTSRRDGGTFSDVQPKSKLPILRKKRRITKFDYSIFTSFIRMLGFSELYGADDDGQLAFLTADFPAILGVLPLPRLRVSAPRNTTF